MSGGDGRKIAVIGDSRGGKGTYVKEVLKKNKMPVKIVSTRNDWGLPIYYDFKTLVKDCMGREPQTNYFPDTWKSHVVIIDEAQVWLPRDLDQLQSEKYRKFFMMLANNNACNNIMIFIMHSFQQMPSWLPTYINGIERFHTSENLQFQINRFPQYPQLIESFKKFPVIEKYKRKYIHIS